MAVDIFFVNELFTITKTTPIARKHLLSEHVVRRTRSLPQRTSIPFYVGGLLFPPCCAGPTGARTRALMGSCRRTSNAAVKDLLPLLASHVPTPGSSQAFLPLPRHPTAPSLVPRFFFHGTTPTPSSRLYLVPRASLHEGWRYGHVVEGGLRVPAPTHNIPCRPVCTAHSPPHT